MSTPLKVLVSQLKDIEVYGDVDVSVDGIAIDSKKVKENYIFSALKGEKRDGLEFLPQALKNGATAILTHTKPFMELKKLAWIYSKNERKTLAEITKKFYKGIDEEIFLCGITGTNGKTTTSVVLESIFNESEIPSGLIGTIEYRWKNKKIKAQLTTPEITDIFELLSQMKSENVQALFMEVSSHSLTKHRVYGLDFNCAVFTNLSGDHLDYHKNMENYYRAKKRLFLMVNKKGFSVINIDNEYGRRLFNELKGEKLSYSVEDPSADFFAEKYEFSIDGTFAIIKTPDSKIKIRTNLIGKPNLYNVLSSIAVSMRCGISKKAIENAFRKEIKIPGRLEKIKFNDSYIFIDYAHSDDSLKSVLKSLRALTKGRLIVVFGAGGDRDKTKRPRMGKVATEIADFSIITNDNPRTEHPLSIIEDILSGIEKSNYDVVEDRKLAIEKAIKALKPGDVLLIAGKGHEDYQIIGEKRFHFSDREVVEEIIGNVNKK